MNDPSDMIRTRARVIAALPAAVRERGEQSFGYRQDWRHRFDVIIVGDAVTVRRVSVQRAGPIQDVHTIVHAEKTAPMSALKRARDIRRAFFSLGRPAKMLGLQDVA